MSVEQGEYLEGAPYIVAPFPLDNTAKDPLKTFSNVPQEENGKLNEVHCGRRMKVCNLRPEHGGGLKVVTAGERFPHEDIQDDERMAPGTSTCVFLAQRCGAHDHRVIHMEWSSSHSPLKFSLPGPCPQSTPMTSAQKETPGGDIGLGVGFPSILLQQYEANLLML